jgi:hypothetical protein
MKKALQYLLLELGISNPPGQFGPLRQDRELDVVRDCLVGDEALFLLPGAFCQITPHEVVFERFGSRTESSRNYFGFGLSLDDGSLRRALNGTVLLAPHLCRMLNLGGSRSERSDIDASRGDYKRMLDHGVISSVANDCLNAVLDLAATYRSSILNAGDIAYCGVPLNVSFSQASFARAREIRAADALNDVNIRYFYDDFIEVSASLVDLVAKHQMGQLRPDDFVQRSMSLLTKPIDSWAS